MLDTASLKEKWAALLDSNFESLLAPRIETVVPGQNYLATRIFKVCNDNWRKHCSGHTDRAYEYMFYYFCKKRSELHNILGDTKPTHTKLILTDGCIFFPQKYTLLKYNLAILKQDFEIERLNNIDYVKELYEKYK